MLALLFVGSVESVLSSLPRSASLSDEGWRRLSHNWPLAVLPREPQANLCYFFIIYIHTYIYIFLFFIFFALHRSLLRLDCTSKTNYDNSLCLTSARYILFFSSAHNSLQYFTLNPAYSPIEQ